MTHADRAAALARLATPLSDPNPRVGCVLTAPDGAVLGEGHTREAGGPHAEVVALRAARAAGADTRGATAWVTLEPCSHHGRTPPCCQALIEAGIARVVVALADPNPLVGGQGIARLRAAGIAVEVAEPSCEWAREARELNIGFLSRMVRGRPWVRMKIAASLDGTTALANGQSQWITSPEARADGHAWRARASAVLTGIGTVRDDDPRLDVRLAPTVFQPLRVVVDSRLEIAPTARLLQPPGRALVYTASAEAGRRRALERPAAPGWATAPLAERVALDGGVEVAPLPEVRDGPSAGKTDLHALMADLARREVNELHVEAGAKLNGSLLRAGVVDEVLLYLAPTLLGPGAGLAALGPLERLADGIGLAFLDVARVGPDLRVRALTAGGRAFHEPG